MTRIYSDCSTREIIKKYCELMPFHVVIPALIWGVWVMHPMCDFSSIDIIFPIVTMVNESSIIINVDE